MPTNEELRAAAERVQSVRDAWLSAKLIYQNRIAELESEVARLRAALEHCQSQAGPDSCADVLVQCEELRRENAELRKDAERYQWLRNQHWNESTLFVVAGGWSVVALGVDCPSGERLDAAIDAAMEGRNQ